MYDTPNDESLSQILLFVNHKLSKMGWWQNSPWLWKWGTSRRRAFASDSTAALGATYAEEQNPAAQTSVP